MKLHKTCIACTLSFKGDARESVYALMNHEGNDPFCYAASLVKSSSGFVMSSRRGDGQHPRMVPFQKPGVTTFQPY